MLEPDRRGQRIDRRQFRVRLVGVFAEPPQAPDRAVRVDEPRDVEREIVQLAAQLHPDAEHEHDRARRRPPVARKVNGLDEGG